jgi:hypothetical protein
MARGIRERFILVTHQRDKKRREFARDTWRIGGEGAHWQRRDGVVVGVGSSRVGDVAAGGGRSGSGCRQQHLGQATSSPSSVAIPAGLGRREPESRRPGCPGRRATRSSRGAPWLGRPAGIVGWSSRRRAPGRRCGTEVKRPTRRRPYQ